jgi:hypothetical protein
MLRITLTCLWKEPDAARPFTSGVSLHSHTNHSRESLSFILKYARNKPLIHWVLNARMRYCESISGVMPDLCQGYWTPPLPARAAFDLERKQIEASLNLEAMISITDHDDIKAPVLLRIVPETRHVPLSTEWTLPFEDAVFHLGVHNLPSNSAAKIMADLARCTADPRPAVARDLLAALHDDPNVLVVLNHPLWDLVGVGQQRHRQQLSAFLQRNGQFIHALELSGVRTWPENREVVELAAGWNQLLISGGDRHGCEPNAVLNMTCAGTFSEFVHQIRRQRESHILFMPQYAEPMPLRNIQTLLDVIRFDPIAPRGVRRWDDRVFHPASDGSVQPVSALWKRPPVFIEAIFAGFRLFEEKSVRQAFKYVLNRAAQEQEMQSRPHQEYGVAS